MSMKVNYLTIDVEDYFQVSAFEDVINVNSWEGYASRVENNVGLLLALLAEHDVSATFFVVGWIAEKYPALVKQIAAAGHDIACHSYLHRKVYDLTPQQFREDTARAKDILEEISGAPVVGYRAPSYSITKKSLWAFEILAELGFLYDSSVFPIVHDVYGMPDAPRFRYDLKEYGLVEYPISTVRLLGRNVPVSGGGYFRLFPYWLTRYGLSKINRDDKQPFIFYLHPWEVDPEQPRVAGAGALSRFRHYNNLDKTRQRLRRLLRDFAFAPLPIPGGSGE